MSNKKFDFTDEIIVVGDVTLHRIIACRDFGTVKKGDLGGFLQYQRNLSYSGICWVSGSARVYDNARVYGDAWVSGSARVYGNARVYGDAQVSGDAWRFSPLCIQGRKHSLTVSSYDTITIGCITKSIDEWLNEYTKIGKENGYSPSEIKEYGSMIRYAIDWMKTVGIREKKPGKE